MVRPARSFFFRWLGSVVGATVAPARNPGVRVPKPGSSPQPVLKIKGARLAILGLQIANFAPLILLAGQMGPRSQASSVVG